MKFHRLRELREDHDITQNELAKKIFTSQIQYSRWETGKYEIPVNILIMLADFYNCSTDYILGRTNKKEINR